MLRSIGRKITPSGRSRLNPSAKQADGFYSSPAWQILCEEIKRERWPYLRQQRGHCCEDPDCRAQHTPATRIYFDHILERRDRPDLELVKSNIIGRCGSSHSKKTAAERAKRYHSKG